MVRATTSILLPHLIRQMPQISSPSLTPIFAASVSTKTARVASSLKVLGVITAIRDISNFKATASSVFHKMMPVKNARTTRCATSARQVTPSGSSLWRMMEQLPRSVFPVQQMTAVINAQTTSARLASLDTSSAKIIFAINVELIKMDVTNVII